SRGAGPRRRRPPPSPPGSRPPGAPPPLRSGRSDIADAPSCSPADNTPRRAAVLRIGLPRRVGVLVARVYLGPGRGAPGGERPARAGRAPPTARVVVRRPRPAEAAGGVEAHARPAPPAGWQRPTSCPGRAIQPAGPG